ncbi:unnamed protein product [Meganyctiphanes norvegica]|uniref:Uncharacterized protein n=1 Tax=Meganyctiphanes norvegica TaxID=48144 RepID=A0AAV2QF12_MEGNR
MNRCEINKNISWLCEKKLVTPKVTKDVNISRNKFCIELESLRVSYKSDQGLSHTQMVDMVNKGVTLDTQANRLTSKYQSFNNTVSCSQISNRISITKEASKFEFHKYSDPVEYFNDKVSNEISKFTPAPQIEFFEVWKWHKRKKLML